MQLWGPGSQTPEATEEGRAASSSASPGSGVPQDLREAVSQVRPRHHFSLRRNSLPHWATYLVALFVVSAQLKCACMRGESSLCNEIVGTLQLRGMHERMAGLDSLATASRSLRHRFEEIQMLLLDKPTRELPFSCNANSYPVTGLHLCRFQYLIPSKLYQTSENCILMATLFGQTSVGWCSEGPSSPTCRSAAEADCEECGGFRGRDPGPGGPAPSGSRRGRSCKQHSPEHTRAVSQGRQQQPRKFQRN